jgi:HlyD family secretion protein
MKKTNKKLYIIIAIILILIVSLIVMKKKGLIGSGKEKEVELGEVVSRSIIEKVVASGTVQPITEVKITPDVAGEIIEINIEEGDSVKRGDLLIRIRPDQLESALDRAKATLNQQLANLAQSRASLSRAKAQYERAKLDFDRQKRLWEEKVISQAEYETIMANYQIAKNDLDAAEQNVVAANYIVKSAEATVREAEENVRFTTIYAPVDGIVSKLNVELGERVVGTQQMAGTEMLRIANLNNMEVRVDVNENDIIRVNLGDTTIVEVDSYTYLNKKFKGIVTTIANTAKDKTSNDAVTEFQVRIRILNESYADLVQQSGKAPFRPGMTATVEIMTDRKDDIISIPISAVALRRMEVMDVIEGTDNTGELQTKTKDNEVEVVFILEDGKAKMVPVTTGISDFEFIEIKTGLKPGDKVITGPFLQVSRLLKDGDEVKDAKDKGKKPEVTIE